MARAAANLFMMVGRLVRRNCACSAIFGCSSRRFTKALIE
jgi:hypothetical protein